MNKWEKLNELYINKGLKIIPIRPNAKIPMINDWRNECSNNYRQILYWYTSSPTCNYALPCVENNLFVIDLDTHDENKNGLVNFEKLMQDIGVPKHETLTQRTPSMGLHLIYKTDDELSQVEGLANAFPDYPGIDLRNRNYIVVEPSIINDREYKFTNNVNPIEMPKELKDYILKTVGTKTTKKKTPYEKPKEVYTGDRDNQLFQYIGNLYLKTRLDFDEILTLACKFNEEILEEPFPESVVRYKVKKAFEKDRGICMYVWLGKDEEQ